MKRYELTKEQWNRVKAILPPERTGQRGRPRKDDRKMLNGMLWIARSGAQWRELPEVYGPWQSVYARFAKWRDDGTLEAVFRALSTDADMENLSLDSACIKVHESANGRGKTGKEIADAVGLYEALGHELPAPGERENILHKNAERILGEVLK